MLAYILKFPGRDLWAAGKQITSSHTEARLASTLLLIWFVDTGELMWSTSGQVILPLAATRGWACERTAIAPDPIESCIMVCPVSVPRKSDYSLRNGRRARRRSEILSSDLSMMFRQPKPFGVREFKISDGDLEKFFEFAFSRRHKAQSIQSVIRNLVDPLDPRLVQG